MLYIRFALKLTLLVTAIASAASAPMPLKDGSVIQAEVLTVDADSVLVRLSWGDSLRIPTALLDNEKPADHGSPRLDGASRYLYSPSSYNIAQGEIHFSQKELFFTTFAYGLTDKMSLQAGSVLPMLFVDQGQNLILGFKYGQTVHNRVGIQAGIQGMLFYDGTRVAPFAGFTLGDRNTHASLNYSPTFNLDEYTFSKKPIHLISIAGAHRVSRSLSIVSENILFTNGDPVNEEDDNLIIGSLALRVHSGRVLLDFGFLVTPGVDIPVPWLDFSIGF